MRVRIQGAIYASIEDAAIAYNISPRTVSRVICEGREDTLKRKREGDKRGKPQPFTIECMTFPNQKAANDAFGLPDNFLTQAVNRNSKVSLAKVLAAALRYKESMR